MCGFSAHYAVVLPLRHILASQRGLRDEGEDSLVTMV